MKMILKYPKTGIQFREKYGENIGIGKNVKDERL